MPGMAPKGGRKDADGNGKRKRSEGGRGGGSWWLCAATRKRAARASGAAQDSGTLFKLRRVETSITVVPPQLSPRGQRRPPPPLLRFLTLFPPPSVPCPLLLPTRGNFLPPSLSLLCHFPSQGCSVRSALSRRSDPRVRGILITELRNRRSIGSFVSHSFLSSSLRGRFFFSGRTLVCVRLANTAADCVLFFLSRS